MNQELKDELRKRQEWLEALIKDKEKALKKVPAGTLRYSINRKRIQYYHRTDPKDTIGQYIRKENRKLAEALAQKDYDNQILKLAKKEVEVVKNLQQMQKETPIEGLYESLKYPRRNLVIPDGISDELYAKQWQEAEYQGKWMRDDVPEYYTAKGEQVRSKTELIIADTLNRLGIPYRYEAPLYLEGAGIIHPDFTVLNVRRRKEFYWEHMGMLDKPTYLEQALTRIELYEQNGYYPGDKLLFTHETSEQPIKTRQIEGLANQFLLY